VVEKPFDRDVVQRLPWLPSPAVTAKIGKFSAVPVLTRRAKPATPACPARSSAEAVSPERPKPPQIAAPRHARTAETGSAGVILPWKAKKPP
jgi:hypothetical protein